MLSYTADDLQAMYAHPTWGSWHQFNNADYRRAMTQFVLDHLECDNGQLVYDHPLTSPWIGLFHIQFAAGVRGQPILYRSGGVDKQLCSPSEYPETV